MPRFKLGVLVLLAGVLLVNACGISTQSGASPVASSPTVKLVTKPSPTQTITPLPTATDTPVPTDTPTLPPTDTPLPTNTPTITRTPGPFSFIDDFSTDSGGWKDCELCSWQDDALLMGPFEASSKFHKNYCTGCGVHIYYELTVDATFKDGQVDRFFGVFVGDNQGEQYFFGISPWQFYYIGQHTDEGEEWKFIDGAWSGIVNASYATNHFKVAVRPALQPNTADYIFSLNGSSVYIIYGVPVGPSRVGLAIDWHAMTVTYDNWKFVEVER